MVPGCCSCSWPERTICILLHPALLLQGRRSVSEAYHSNTIEKKASSEGATAPVQASNYFTQLHGLQGNFFLRLRLHQQVQGDLRWFCLDYSRKRRNEYVRTSPGAEGVSRASSRAALQRQDVLAQMRFLQMNRVVSRSEFNATRSCSVP